MSIENGNNGNKPDAPMSPLDTMPKVAEQIIINLHVGGRVTGRMPTDMKVAMYMLGQFLTQIGPLLTFNPPSPIVKAPAGLVIPGGRS
jgi:hypothetical protein